MIDGCVKFDEKALDLLRGLLPPQQLSLLKTGFYGTDPIETFGLFLPIEGKATEGDRVQEANVSVQPAGFAVNRYPEGGGASLLILKLVEKIEFGSPKWQETAGLLMSGAFDGAVARGVKTYSLEYDEDMKERVAMETLFSNLGFQPPVPYGRTCRCVTRKILTAPWVQDPVFPDGFETFLWKDLSDGDRNMLANGGLSEMKVHPLLSPFRDPHMMEPLNSLGLMSNGRIIGWQINHRISSSTIRYTSTFIREDLQSFGLVLPLMGRSIGLQFSGGMWCNRAVFMVPYEMKAMSRFVDRKFGRYVDEIREIFHVEKQIG